MCKQLLSAGYAALCLGASPSYAASAQTDAFVANVRIDVFFLGKASTLAADRSEDGDLRAFAGKEARAEETVIAELDGRTAPEVAHMLPLNVASNDVITGRSAAIDHAPADARFAAPTGNGALMPAAMITLDRLSASKGQAFDTLYKVTQINALRQLSGLYNAYGMTGDDAALKQLAESELAATDGRIAEIGRLNTGAGSR